MSTSTNKMIFIGDFFNIFFIFNNKTWENFGIMCFYSVKLIIFLLKKTFLLFLIWNKTLSLHNDLNEV